MNYDLSVPSKANKTQYFSTQNYKIQQTDKMLQTDNIQQIDKIW